MRFRTICIAAAGDKGPVDRGGGTKGTGRATCVTALTSGLHARLPRNNSRQSDARVELFCSPEVVRAGDFYLITHVLFRTNLDQHLC
jgi:hypothetical protein